MQISEKLFDRKLWEAYLNEKVTEGYLSKQETEELKNFIENEEYLPVCENVREKGVFSVPLMSEINKSGSGKKRLVFTFSREENLVLKMISYLLRDYDHIFPEDLYSFRKGIGVKTAVSKVRKPAVSGRTWSYKADIHDYFNSIDPVRMLERLKTALPEEPDLLRLFENMLTSPYAMFKGEKVTVRKGIMAGVPVSGFMADLYLAGLDRWFLERGITYARYSDDVIVFADSEEEINAYESHILSVIESEGLVINEKKVVRTSPGEETEFLGFTFSEERVSVAPISVSKIKAKLRRKARAIYRWKIRKNAPDTGTVKAYIKYLNRKFYGSPLRGEVTWARWYFPVITDDRELKEIDDYAVECIRYLVTGNHGKKNYELRYETIKELGFTSLVNSYWKFREGRYLMPSGKE